MKKHLILSMMAVLCLTGCGGNASNGGKKGGKSSGGTVSGDITLKAASCLSMMSENCQKYVDDMHEQHERLVADNPNADYYLNDLFGENGVDLTKGVVASSNENTNDGGYRENPETDGNEYLDDVKAEWEKGEKSDENKGVEISFEVADSLKNKEYTISYSVNSDMSDAESFIVEETSARLKNLLVNQKYYYRVSVDGKNSAIGEFTTGDYPRWIDARPMFNVRDMGGYMTSSGKRIKQGLIYRGGEITNKSWNSGSSYRGDTGGRYVNSSNMMSDGHIKTQDDDNKSKDVFRDVMGMVNGLEIDLRNSSETNGYPTTQNICNFAIDGDIRYEVMSISSYDNGMKNNKTQIKKVFEAFAEADEHPVYYHCYGGADRTGVVGFMLGALLGMSYTDLVIDFELTSYSSNPSRNYRSHLRNGPYNYWPRMVKYLKNDLGWNSSKTIQESMKDFLKSCSISDETLNKISDIMLED